MSKRCGKCGQMRFDDIMRDYKEPIVNKLLAVIASYPLASDAEHYMEKQGEALGYLNTLFCLDHNRNFPSPEELKDMERFITARLNDLMRDWLLENKPINMFLHEEGKEP